MNFFSGGPKLGGFSVAGKKFTGMFEKVYVLFPSLSLGNPVKIP